MSDNKNIFATHAPAYHAAGLSAIPLASRKKQPIINGWQRYADLKVDAATSREWIKEYPTGNIGLALGEVSGLVMVDIDTEDRKVYDAIMAVLPPSPWHRLGKKGMMLAYKWTPLKTCRVKNISGETIVEILSSRTQCVLPPSIHPDTLAPYTSNVPLLDVLHQLCTLPDDIETRLRQAIAACGVNLSLSGSTRVTEYVSAGSRDTSLTEMAGLFAYAIIRGERTLKEAIGMLRSYHSEFIENTSGDIVPCEKHIENMIRFLHRDVQEKGKILPIGWDEGIPAKDLKKMGITFTEDDTEWDFDKILDFLQKQFEAHEQGKARTDAIERVLSKVAKSKQLTKLDTERILNYIVNISAGLGLGLPVLRQRIKELRAGDVMGQDHSEIARAVIKDLEDIGLFRYHHDGFMRWNGSHWESYSCNMIKSHISSHYGHLAACRKNGDINGIVNIVTYLLPQGILTEEVKGVNFVNGFLTQELKLVAHNPAYGMTYTLPFRYVPEESGRFPQFAEFLERVWGHDDDYLEKMQALQEAMCVTLFGLGPKFQRAVLLHGAPASGKSQLLRIIEAIVPDHARTAVPPEHWDDKFLPAQLHTKILNICGELSERNYINGQKFKDIIDGTEMSAQHKNQQVFQFRPLVTHWFASNHMPKTRDTSRGFIRRWLMLTFTRPISSTEKKLDIGLQIAGEEREAIVAWAAQAMPRLLHKNDYTLPPSHIELVNEFANINNSVRFYLKESGKIRITPGESTNELSIYNSYWSFCLGGGGVQPVGPTMFRAMLRELGSELGFSLKVLPGKFGTSEARYDGISMKTAN